MKAQISRIRDIKQKTMDALQNIWVETIMTGMLLSGVFCLQALIILIMGKAMGVSSSDGVFLVPVCISPAFALSSGAVLAVGYILGIPLYFGIRWYFWQAARGKYMPISSIFACYTSREMVIRSLKLKLSVDLRRTAYLLILSVPALFIGGIIKKIWDMSAKTPLTGALLILGGFTAAMVLGAVFVMLTARFIPVGYILAENPDYRTKQIMNKGREIINRNHFALFMTYFSCWRTYMSALLILPLLFIPPFLFLLTSVFISEAMKEQKAGETVAEGI